MADEGTLKKMAGNTVADYFAQDGKKLDAAVKEVQEILEMKGDTHAFIDVMLVIWLELHKPDEIDMLKVLITRLGQEKFILSRDYDDVVKTQVEGLIDLAYDVPKAPTRFAEAIACGVACGAASIGVLTLTEFDQFGGGPWGRLVCNVFALLGADGAKAALEREGVDFIKAATAFGLTEDDFRQQLADKGLGDVL